MTTRDHARRAAQRFGATAGDPIEAGSKVAVEWWTTMRDGENEITLPGCLVLRFAEDGRCQELREYWHIEHRRIDPPEGWGR